MRTISLISLAILFACGASPAQKKETPAGSKSKFANEFAYIDSVIKAQPQDRPQTDSVISTLTEYTGDDVSSIVKEERKKGLKTWTEFKSLCDENKDLDALQYFEANKNAIYVYFPLSELTYYFPQYGSIRIVV